MDTPMMSIMWQQFSSRAPTLLVFVVGFVVALTYLSRAQRPATFALVACVILIVEGVVFSALWAWFVSAQFRADMDMGNRAWLSSALSWGGSIVRAGGLGLLIAAVFVDRGENPARRRRRDEDSDDRPPRPRSPRNPGDERVTP